METNQLKYVLEELRFSADMPPEVLEQLAMESTIREISSCSLLFREGSEAENLYLVRNGRLALEMNVPGRGAVRILTLGPGEMVGWSALLGEGRMTAAAVAMEDCELVEVAASRVRELCESNHDFGFYLMRQMAAALSKRLVATRLQLLDLFSDVPPEVPVDGSG